jgi:hypothetical protein
MRLMLLTCRSYSRLYVTSHLTFEAALCIPKPLWQVVQGLCYFRYGVNVLSDSLKTPIRTPAVFYCNGHPLFGAQNQSTALRPTRGVRTKQAEGRHILHNFKNS